MSSNSSRTHHEHLERLGLTPLQSQAHAFYQSAEVLFHRPQQKGKQGAQERLAPRPGQTIVYSEAGSGHWRNRWMQPEQVLSNLTALALVDTSPTVSKPWLVTHHMGIRAALHFPG